MIHDAKGFITDWVSENVNSEAYAPEGDTERARELAEQCRSDAKAKGISDQELDAAVDDLLGGGSGLVAYIADAMEDATDDEVQRLADKDG